MDIITDLTSQSVSFIVILQDVCRKQPSQLKSTASQPLRLWELVGDENDWKQKCDDGLRGRLRDLLWFSNRSLSYDRNKSDSRVGMEARHRFDSFSFKIVKPLIEWMKEHFQNLPADAGTEEQVLQVQYGTIYSTPYELRNTIRNILYHSPTDRTRLSRILLYMPIQVVLALAGNKADVYNQRICQVWAPSIKQIAERPPTGSEEIFIEDILCSGDESQWTKWWMHTLPELWDRNAKETSRLSQAAHLIENEIDLRKCLDKRNNPVPFETLFHKELNEISESRRQRMKLNKERWATRKIIDPFQNIRCFESEERRKSRERREGNIKAPNKLTSNDKFSVAVAIASLAGFPGDTGRLSSLPAPGDRHTDPGDHGDPMERAQKMGLVGLAFSGGGIRSATFNLGVLQHLAERNILSNVDYMSTVSGGGYIGTWVASWIKRTGSVHKVEDRLNPNGSVEPMAEEVRPIRWLRMYSNYLTPNASIMSVDSWTLGVTWLRNTIINQLLLLLLLCSFLSIITLLFTLWKWTGEGPGTVSPMWVALGSMALLIPGCFIAGVGMKSFDREHGAKPLTNWGRHRYLSLVLVGLSILSAFVISVWIYSRVTTEIGTAAVTFPDKLMVLLPAASVGAASILLIAFLGRYYDTEESAYQFFVHLVVVLSSLIAAAVGWVLMAAVWELLFVISRSVAETQRPRVIFLLGVPLILEVFSAVVIARMAMMGRLFPDARREWWGRMGAITHRFSLIWILVCTAGLFLLDTFRDYANERTLQALLPVFGGWAGIVGYGVKLAYNSSSEKSHGASGVKEVFIRFVPYLFMIGFILGGCYLLAYITDQYGEMRWPKETPISDACVVTAGFIALTLFLSWRVGVNEFSLHYFYRNRLVRAYLGATRGRVERSKTANNFTGLDLKDDEKLHSFTTQYGYYGPYPILNTALNATSVTELDRQDRKAESFMFSPLYCGFDFSPIRSSSYNKIKGFEYGYRSTEHYGYRKGSSIGTAMAISGAAVSPNMGYHSSAATAFLLTVFNVRMGWWMGNPRMDTWQNSDPALGLAYIVKDLIGRSDIESDYVCLSDGGHFDNMGLYELIRRRCTYIILSDAEEDQGARCEGLANAIRRCRIDFGTEILIDTTNATKKKKFHVVRGEIKYPGDETPSGTLIYIKTVVTGDESPDIKEYHSQHPAFPNESTGDQFFDEAQFESYRQLGYHSASVLTESKI